MLNSAHLIIRVQVPWHFNNNYNKKNSKNKLNSSQEIKIILLPVVQIEAIGVAVGPLDSPDPDPEIHDMNRKKYTMFMANSM